MSASQSGFTQGAECPYFEIAGYKIEKQNHGAPQSQDMKINEKNASSKKPQAWSKEIDGTIHWFYNFPGAITEAKYLGKKIPTIDEWMQILENIDGNPQEKAKALSIPLVGMRYSKDGLFYEQNEYANLWSSSEYYTDRNACFVYLSSIEPYVDGDGVIRELGMSVRFFWNE